MKLIAEHEDGDMSCGVDWVCTCGTGNLDVRIRCRSCYELKPGMEPEVPGVREYYEGKLMDVVDASRGGWWRFHKHYDRHGYCDNPARGY